MPTFDGANLIITLDAGVGNVDVKVDMYSDWKEWQLLSDNMKYPLAFRTTGGDALTPGIDAGAYFFIQNQNGWRVRPAEENATILLTGNLAPEDSTIDIMVPTIGAFTVLVDGLQPITQNVDTILTLQQTSSYNGEVFVNTASGSPGTVYPLGTASAPVDNWADAQTIATQLGFTKFSLSGAIILDSALTFSEINTHGAHGDVDFNGQDMSGSTLTGCHVTGAIGALTSPVIMSHCTVEDISGFFGSIIQGRFIGTIGMAAGVSSFEYCVSGIAGIATAVIDFNDQILELGVRAYTGGIELINMTDPGVIASVDLLSGRLVCGATDTAGTLIMRGVGIVDDTGATFDVMNTDGLVSGLDILFSGDDAVHINSITGDDINNGRVNTPVKTAARAKILADDSGLSSYHFVGSITLTSAHDRWNFVGVSAQFNDTLNLNNQSVDESRIQGCRISGDATESNIEALFCEIDNPGNLHGIFRQCGLLNTFKVEATTPQTYIFHHCYSQVAGSGRPTLDFTNLAVIHNVQFRNYTGGINVINMVQGNLSIDTPGGTVDLQATVTGGDIVVRGTGIMINDSGASVTVAEGFIDGLDFRLIKQILGGKADVSMDDQTITIYDEDNVTVLATLSVSVDGRNRARTA